VLCSSYLVNIRLLPSYRRRSGDLSLARCRFRELEELQGAADGLPCRTARSELPLQFDDCGSLQLTHYHKQCMSRVLTLLCKQLPSYAVAFEARPDDVCAALCTRCNSVREMCQCTRRG